MIEAHPDTRRSPEVRQDNHCCPEARQDSRL